MPTEFTHEGTVYLSQYDGLKEGKNGPLLRFTLETGLQCIMFTDTEEALALIQSGPIKCSGEIVLNTYKSYRGPQGKVSKVESAAEKGDESEAHPFEEGDIEPF